MEQSVHSHKPLVLIGYWEDPEEGEPWIHPRVLVDPNWDANERDAIAQYLLSGIRIHEMLGFATCRLDDAVPDSEMGNAELSDGTFVWPEALPVYVSRFNVKLPSEFLEHIKANGYKVPSALEQEVLERRGVDDGYWRNWCSENRPRFWKRVLSRFKS